jgi:hypothetical protein
MVIISSSGWADTFPWAAFVSAIEHSFGTRFPQPSRRD